MIQICPYTPLAYYTGERDEQDVPKSTEPRQIMKILTVKRSKAVSPRSYRLLDDSFIHTRESLGSFIRAGCLSARSTLERFFELLESDDQEGIDQLLEAEKAEELSASDFAPEFLADLENDLKALTAIRNQWKKSRAIRNGNRSA